jgi:TatA/E family protein of Tat protein translocase
MPFNIGAPELILILAVALLVLGPKRLPEVGASLGKSIREFRKATSEVQESLEATTTPTSPTPAQPNQMAQPVQPNQLAAQPSQPAAPPTEQPPTA